MANVPDITAGLSIMGQQTLPKEAYRKIFCLGLSFSPLFVCESRFDYTQPPKTTKLKPEDGTVALGPGMTAVGAGELTTFGFDYHFNGHMSFLNWSAVLALLVLVLLVLGWWVGRRLRRNPVSSEKPGF